MSAPRFSAFDQVFSFIYSPRPYTHARVFEDETPLEVKRRRLSELQKRQKRIQRTRNERLIGQCVEVLCEGRSKKNPDTYSGRTRCARIVNFEADSDAPGRLVSVKVEAASPYSLWGREASALGG